MKKEPKVFEVRKLFRILVIGGTLTAAGCGPNPCPNGTQQTGDGGSDDGGAASNNCQWAGGGGGGHSGW